MRACIIGFFLAMLLSPLLKADPLSVIDLGSNTDWTFRKENMAASQPAVIPDQISIKGSKDRWIDYQRTVLVPKVVSDQVTDLHFLSVNDGGEIFVNGKSVGTVDYGLFPADVDISDAVKPGQIINLKVRCFSRNNYYPAGAFPQDHNGDELLGIPRGVSLIISSPVHVVDSFVKTSVTDETIGYELWIDNHTPVPHRVVIHTTFSPWNKGDSWNYPDVPDQVVALPASSETKVNQGPTKWTAGTASYWWPNIPFREGYQARLHNIRFNIVENNSVLDQSTRRFGFVEHGEGPTFYTINKVRIFQFQDGTQEHAWSPNHHDGFQTSYAQLPGWSSGAAETWRNYLRLGFNTFRLHNSAGSESMLDDADEVGFMIVGESGIRGYAKPEESWSPVYKPAAIEAMARFYRSHPSVFRYSLDNEWAAATRDETIARGLIDAAVAADPARPLSFSQDKSPWVKEFFGSDKRHHAFVLDHYHTPATQPDAIAGIEEEYWDRKGTNRNELIECSRAAILDRMDGLAVFSPWTLNNYWCNFVQGGGKNTGTVNPIWKNKDRQDGVDGWGSDIIRFMRNCYDIYASADVDLIQHHLNKEYLIFDPSAAVTFENQKQISRQMVTFNNSLAPHQMSIAWQIHLDAAKGLMTASGETATMKLNPGQPAMTMVTFPCPDTAGRWRLAYFVIQTRVDGKIMFTEDRYFFKVKSGGK
jgi:hypothetical protein